MGDEDEDRAAILRRRQRLIALALSGLTGAAGCDDPAPDPAASGGPAHERTVDEGAEPAHGPAMEPVDPEAEAAEDEALFAAAPVDDGPPDPEEVRHAEDAKRRWQRNARPRPCLTRAIPTACLSRAPRPTVPAVCLFKKAEDDSDEDPA